MGPATSRTSRRTSIDQADTAHLLTRLFLTRMVWTITEMGSLTGCPPPHAAPGVHHTTFDAWAQHLGLPAERQRFRRGMCHLKARGNLDGVDVMIWSAHLPELHTVYDR